MKKRSIRKSQDTILPDDKNERTTLSVLTFNVWDVFNAKDRDIRMEGILQALLEPEDGGVIRQHDVIAFQEMWRTSVYNHFTDRLRPLYPHSKYFHSGMVCGSGLAIFSRFPIVRSEFHPFVLSGRPHYVTEGDFYAGKGVGHVRLQYPLGLIDVFVSHFVANYFSRSGHDHNLCHRISQSYELARFVETRNHPAARAVLVMGDFNMEEDAIPYRAFFENDQINGMQSVTAGMTPAEFATCHAPDNVYTPKGSVPESIDKILFHGDLLSLLSVERAFTKPLPSPRGQQLSYSDHCGVAAIFEFRNVGTDITRRIQVASHALIGTVHQLFLDEAEMIQSEQIHYIFWFNFSLAMVVGGILIGLMLNRTSHWVTVLQTAMPLIVFAASSLGVLGHLYYNRELTALMQFSNEMEHFLDLSDPLSNQIAM